MDAAFLAATIWLNITIAGNEDEDAFSLSLIGAQPVAVKVNGQQIPAVGQRD
jgi:hypothetical protein